MRRTKVVVVGGGANTEHEVSLASAASMAVALAEAGYEVTSLTIGRDGTWRDHAEKTLSFPAAVEQIQECAVVVPALHGPHGEDGTIAALCDLAGIPWVGSGLTASAVGMDKWMTKVVAEAVDVRTARATLVMRGSEPPSVALPVVVKPVAAGSSHGVSLVRCEGEFENAVRAAFAIDNRVLVEEVVEGREIDVAVLRRADGSYLVAPALEILPTTSGIFDLVTKYDGSARFVVPAALLESEARELESAAVRVFDALGCAGVARIDFFLTKDGPVLNEVNTMPGFTEHSQVPSMFAAADITYPELVDILVQDALATMCESPKSTYGVACRMSRSDRAVECDSIKGAPFSPTS